MSLGMCAQLSSRRCSEKRPPQRRRPACGAPNSWPPHGGGAGRGHGKWRAGAADGGSADRGLAVLVCLQCALATTFYPWVDKAAVIDGLKPSEVELSTASFLEYVVDARALAASAGCDGSFECDDYQENGQQASSQVAEEQFYKPAAQPKKVTFPVGRIPPQAKCYIKCNYRQSYEFTIGSAVPASENESSSFGVPAHTTRAHAAHHASFLETGSSVNEPISDAVPVNNIGSPFHCQTVCDFPHPLWCNEMPRMVIGSAGFTIQEHSCCELCEAKCRGKTVVDRFRVCYLGCRSFCPFAA